MDKEIQVYFMINPDPVGNEQGLHYGKKKTIIFLCLFLGSCGVVFNKGIGGFVFYFHILVFQYFIKRENAFKILSIFIIMFIILQFFLST